MRWTWAISDIYPGRAHLASVNHSRAVCGMPVDQIEACRPGSLRICPECAIGFVAICFPALGPC
jgi:hypothetical protein